MSDPETTFTLADQQAFARLSGDTNPMHLDPVFARRTQASAPVVHGIHGLLWALDICTVSRPEIGEGIRARFENFLYLDQIARSKRTRRGQSESIEVESGGRTVTSIVLGTSIAPPSVTVAPSRALPTSPDILQFEGIEGVGGAFQLAGTDAEYETRFPRIAKSIGSRRCRAIGGLSALVGMLVPGLHSIFSRCEIALTDEHAGGEELHYRVLRTNALLRSVVIVFLGAGISGRIDAFVRTPPVSQPSISDLAALETKSDFLGRRVLVVGGSRGIGETTAKLAAIRGASVTITYLNGRDDANRIVDELRAYGADAHARRFDSANQETAPSGEGHFSDVFYYATPPIFARSQASYDARAADRFMAVYCHDFARLAASLAMGDRQVNIFWPSTTALDDFVPGLTEYSIAKAAGETLCRQLRHEFPSLRILARRLPRLETDQTASVIPVKSQSAEMAVRAILDAMSEMRA